MQMIAMRNKKNQCSYKKNLNEDLKQKSTYIEAMGRRTGHKEKKYKQPRTVGLMSGK